jgi:hypothetical protein
LFAIIIGRSPIDVRLVVHGLLERGCEESREEKIPDILAFP